jgi:hypothetical protein
MTGNLKIARGLFRLWLVASVLWVGAVGAVTLFDLTHPTLLTSAEAGFPSEPADDALIRNTHALQFAAGLGLAPPMLVLIIGSALGWAVRGFRY